MIKDSKKVEKLLDAFFNHSTVHPYPVIRILKEMRSTYDGDYPYFELVYDATNYNDGNEMDKLIERRANAQDKLENLEQFYKYEI